MVRERVIRIIRGKHLVGYNLQQKLADFGLFANIDLKEGSGEKAIAKLQLR